MTAIATNRVVADFYHGIAFPPDWARHPTRSIGIGLAGRHVFSVAVLLDAKADPLAACWQTEGDAEKFVRVDSGGDDGNLLDALDDDLATASHKACGRDDLFATLLWEPKSLRAEQGIDVHPPRTGSFFDPIAEARGWNVAPNELVANASRLLLVRHQNATGLSLPVPSTAAEMHVNPDDGARAIFVVLPTTK